MMTTEQDNDSAPKKDGRGRHPKPWLVARNKANARHGETTEANGRGSREWTTWHSMRQRCSTTAKPRDLVRYYERGIRVCDRWQTFENFLADMGRVPAGMTLDRIDNDRGYEPGNCRWASRRDQARNRSSTVFVEWNGARRSVAEWSEITGIERHTLGNRLRRGWAVEDAMTEKVSKGNCWRTRGVKKSHP